MRRLRFVLAIVGFFLPFVMGSQTFGTTELRAFDTDFLRAPASPGPQLDAPPVNPGASWQNLLDAMSDEPQALPADTWEVLLS